MSASAICRITFVVCLIFRMEFPLCNADKDLNDYGHEQKTTQKCFETCFHVPVSGVTNTKITTIQTCYDECLRTLGKKDLTTEKQKKSQVFKRFKRAETVQKTCEVKPSLCQEDEQRRVNGIPANNITITFHKLRDTGRFYANVSWTPPPAGPDNSTGYRLIYIMGRYWDYCCRDVNKVLTLPLTPGTPVEVKREEVVLTAKTPETINQSSSSSSTTQVSQESISASLSKGNKASREKILIITAPSIFVLLVVTVSAYWYFRYLSTQRQPAREEHEQDVDYDAFIIYSSADEKWVNKILCPILEEKHGLRCCVHHRDFVVGKPFRENMADSVYKSRKIIAVVSRNFFKSKYCSQEMDMALGRSLDRGDDSVIVIKYEDGVDTRKLPKALRQRSYIDYPKLIEKEMWERRLVDCLKHVPGKKTSPVGFV
ncbi:hypothetical protein ABFA07_012699 [Porites harrisoni]